MVFETINSSLLLCGGACTSGMVLDRQNATLWGVGTSPNVKITIQIHTPSNITKTYTAVSDILGMWEIPSLGSYPPGIGYNISALSTDGSSVLLVDVAFGDIFLCSGQSNMEYPISGIVNNSAVMKEADMLGSWIRVMRINHLSSPNATIETLRWDLDWSGSPGGCHDRCGGPWTRMKDTEKSFSAVCYLAGKNVFLALEKKIPIGLVESNWGGTRIESWISPIALSQCPGTGTSKCGPCLSGLDTEQHPQSQPKQEFRPYQVCARMNSTNSGNLCSCNYNGMMYPIRKMRFRAMLWYQGESNTDSFQGTYPGPANYACRMKTAIKDWRNLFTSPNLPIFYVELAACNSYPSEKANQYTWTYIRQASRSALTLPKTGFITALDVGTNNGAVHSNVKQPVGWRLSLQLLVKVYKRTDLVADGPTLARAPSLTLDLASTAQHIILNFRNAPNLHVQSVANYDTTGSKLGCGESPFEIGWSNGTWTRAVFSINIPQKIVNLTYTLPNESKPDDPANLPTEVRYAWQGFVQCALYSGVGGYDSLTALPAAPFRIAVGNQCAQNQTRCSLQGITIGADPEASQCCTNGEVCIPFGGCQDLMGPN